MYASTLVVNRGDILTSGMGNSLGDGGFGGDVELYGQSSLENSGVINTAGGSASGASGLGGDGGYIDLVGDIALNNSGSLTASGGNGIDVGGLGGWVWLEVFTEGDLRNSGAIDTTGGDATAGSGGLGGEVDIYAYGGSLYHNAPVTTSGGNTTDSLADGGNGGYIAIGTFQGWNVATPAGDLVISGSLDTSGGSAAPAGSGNGGYGGTVDFYVGNYAVDDPAQELNQRLRLLGYKGIDTGGGSGNFGGSGGEVDLLCDYGYVNPANLVNEAAISTRGGSVAAGALSLPSYGGKGGDVYLEAYADPFNIANPQKTRVVNSGSIDATGGTSLEFDGSVAWGGSAGYVLLYGPEGVTNGGSITSVGGADGGTDGGATGIGGMGNWIVLFSEGPLVNTGVCDASGGAGEYRGGNGGEVHLAGEAVSNSGAMIARGGNANPGLFGSVGGSGGYIEIASPVAGGSVTSPVSYAVSGGSGATGGSAGMTMVP